MAGVEHALADKRAARRAFDRAAIGSDAWGVHDEARQRLLERLDFLKLDPQTLVDLGCAAGRATPGLHARYPNARVVGIDSSLRMLRAARRTGAAMDFLGADAERLPLQAGRADLVLANLVLPWCRPDVVFAEAARVLATGGLLLFATLGPDTLAEVRRAWARVDDRIHVHAAFDMHDLADLCLSAGLDEPVVDVDRLTVTYAELPALVNDLRATGAVNVAGGRRRSLTGAGRWRAFERAFLPEEAGRRFAVTVELVLGHAWGRGPAQGATGRAGEFGVPVERIGRRSETT